MAQSYFKLIKTPNFSNVLLERIIEKRKQVWNNVKYVISDMYEPYLDVTKAMFHNAKFVVDGFHYVRYIMQALDKIRIRLQDKFGYNSKEYRLLKNKKDC